MPTKSKSRTTTRSRAAGVSLGAGRRLPARRPPTHPGEMLIEEFLRPLEISQSAFAIRLGISFPRLNEIVRGKRGVTPDTALRLERVLGMRAEFWLGLQLDWDLWQALQSRDAAAIARLEPLRQAS
jgi:addiction module HigA family antidote